MTPSSAYTRARLVTATREHVTYVRMPLCAEVPRVIVSGLRAFVADDVSSESPPVYVEVPAWTAPDDLPVIARGEA